MKKILLAVCLAFVFAGSNAQSVLKPTSFSIYGPFDEFELFDHALFINNSTETQFRWVRSSNAIPAEWSSAVCDNVTCHPPDKDSSDFTVNTGDTVDFSLHFYPANTAGTGTMTLMVFPVSNREDAITGTYTAGTWGLSVPKFSRISSLKLFPNPAKDRLFIELASKAAATGEIYSVTGSLVKSFTAEEANTGVAVSELPKGVYIVKVSNDGQSITRKFIKSE